MSMGLALATVALVFAAYAVGWFDDVKEMEKVYDSLKGKSKIVVGKDTFSLQ